MATPEPVTGARREGMDREIPMNVVELGLIGEVLVEEDHRMDNAPQAVSGKPVRLTSLASTAG